MSYVFSIESYSTEKKLLVNYFFKKKYFLVNPEMWLFFCMTEEINMDH